MTEKTTGDIVETFYYVYDYSGRQIHRQWQKLEPWNEERDKGYYGEDPHNRCIGFTGEDFHEYVVTLEQKEYNGFGKLLWVYRDTEQSLYTYRPDGLRHEKVVTTLKGSTLTRHIWNGGSIIADANEHGVFARYIRGNGLIAREQDNLLQYYLFNAHGDVVQRTDHYGGVLKSYDYDAFGVEKNPEKLDSNPFRYCSEYLDLGGGEYYLRNRYYNPANGRFTSEDPIRSGPNWYTYCGSNPLMFVDPLGLAATSYTTASKIATSSPSTAAQQAAKAGINNSYKTASSIANNKSTNTSAQQAAKAAIPSVTTTAKTSTTTTTKVTTPATTSSKSTASSSNSYYDQWNQMNDQIKKSTTANSSSSNSSSNSSTISPLPQITTNMLQKDFVEAVYARGKANENKTGIPAAIFTAQACLESGYGTSNAAINYNNLFGFMAKGKIRYYDSIEDSILSYERTLTGLECYQGLFELETVEDWAYAIGPAGYCPDVGYDERLLSVIRMWDLR